MEKSNDNFFDETNSAEESNAAHIEKCNDKQVVKSHDINWPVVKSSKVIPFLGINYADVVNSRDITLNSFTVSVWFNTAMNTIAGNNVFLLNKGGIGDDRPGYNLNYGLFLKDQNKVGGGFETLTGEDYIITTKSFYNDGAWHNAILTFDEELHRLNLYIDGLEVACNPTNIGITPDTTGEQPIRLGANSYAEKGKINGNYTGQLDDIQVWDFAFTKEQVASLFDTESKIAR